MHFHRRLICWLCLSYPSCASLAVVFLSLACSNIKYVSILELTNKMPHRKELPSSKLWKRKVRTWLQNKTKTSQTKNPKPKWTKQKTKSQQQQNNPNPEILYRAVFVLAFLLPWICLSLAESASCAIFMVLSCKGERQRKNLTSECVLSFLMKRGPMCKIT